MSSARWNIEVGTTLCPECGGDPTRRDNPTRWEMLRHWLRLGMRLGPTLSCDRGHQWAAGSSGSRLVIGSRKRLPARLVRVPKRLYRWFKHGRWVQPTPIVYLVAAAVGVLVGVIADLVLGWPWWLCALGVVVLIWLFFASSVFWRFDRDEFLSLMAPRRAQAQALSRLSAAVESGDLVAYGLKAWDGSCSIGGWGARNGRQYSVSMRFEEGDRRISVSTTDLEGGQESISLIRENVGDNLVGATGETPPPGLSSDDWHKWRARQRVVNQKRAGLLEWETGSIVVDGDSMSADVTRIEGGSAAVVDLGRVAVSIIATGAQVGECRLQRLTSLHLYVEGDLFGF